MANLKGFLVLIRARFLEAPGTNLKACTLLVSVLHLLVLLSDEAILRQKMPSRQCGKPW